MADAIVGNVLETIQRQLVSRARMVTGAKDELERLENDVRLLYSLLDDEDAREAVRSSGLDLERQIRELAYDARDIRELWLVHRAAVTAAKRNIWRRYLTLEGIGVYRLARQISSTRDGRVDPLFRRIEAYRDLQLQGVQKHHPKVKQVPSVQLNTELPPIRLEKIVGLKDDAEALIRCLIQETEELDVISITGMPGIGKTTLAWRIYQDETIRSEFPARIWVDLPLSFDSKDMYLNILIELFKQGMLSYDELVIWFDMPHESDISKEVCVKMLYKFTESGRINDHQLVHATHASLKNNKFLLVMDDVWTNEILECIRCFLPKTGKVLVTSRNSRVATKPRELCLLNEEESWELLQLEVFGKLDDCPDMLKPVGESIAKSCDGLPLAISVVASCLVVPSLKEAADDLMTKNSWKKVSENVAMYVTEYGVQRNVFERVDRSYARLPQYMQNCLLYLGVFPEGHEIRVWTLIRLWIAEGLVQDSWGLTLEETAERNLYDLISKNLVSAGKIYPNGLIKTCRVHKVIYGFCRYKAAEQEFYHEIKLSRGGALDSPVPLNSNHRRLCINSCLSVFLQSRPDAPCVGSVLCLNKGTEVLDALYSSTIHRPFKLLKIFECMCIEFPKFPKMLSKLMNLRYISLSCDDLDVIPETITSLIYLETLVVVNTRSDSFKLKANIWRMFQLRHLVTKAAIVLSIRGNGEAGENLLTLTRLAPACCTEDVLTRTPNLKSLGIRGKLYALSEAEAMRRLEFLENLKLINEPAADIRWQPNCFPPNLKRLTLSGTYLGWDLMSVLGQIDSLEILKLKNNAFVGRSWTSTHADGFRRLGFLMIATTDLVSWEASDECFPSLKSLVLKNCAKLVKIPSTLAIILDTLDVDEVPESAMESAREIEHEIARRQGQSRR